jgi:hypothetical protein
MSPYPAISQLSRGLPKTTEGQLTQACILEVPRVLQPHTARQGKKSGDEYLTFGESCLVCWNYLGCFVLFRTTPRVPATNIECDPGSVFRKDETPGARSASIRPRYVTPCHSILRNGSFSPRGDVPLLRAARSRSRFWAPSRDAAPPPPPPRAPPRPEAKEHYHPVMVARPDVLTIAASAFPFAAAADRPGVT